MCIELEVDTYPFTTNLYYACHVLLGKANLKLKSKSKSYERLVVVHTYIESH